MRTWHEVIGDRKAVRWLNFKGDITADALGQTVGPTSNPDEFLIAVDAHYDSTPNKTRIGYAYLSRAEYLEIKFDWVDGRVIA